MSEKWYIVLFKFWNDNLLQNVKKISIGLGSFLIVVITTCTLPTELFLASMYGAGITFGTIFIMSVFGKNGNHYEPDVNKVSESEIPDELFGSSETKEVIPEPTVKKEVITIP